MCKEGINQNATVEGKNMAPTYSHLSKDLITGTTHQSQRQWDRDENRILSVTSDTQVSKCVALFGGCRECTVKFLLLISGFTYVMRGYCVFVTT